jgi:hypothetical protein
LFEFWWLELIIAGTCEGKVIGGKEGMVFGQIGLTTKRMMGTKEET